MTGPADEKPINMKSKRQHASGTGHIGKIFLILLFCLSATVSCTYYRTFNALHWAREAYKDGMRTEQGQQKQQKQRNPFYSRSHLEGVQVPGAKSYEEAARKCLAFLAEAPEGRWSDDALILMGKSFFRLKRYVQAESSLRKLLDTQPKSKFRDDAQYYLVQIMLARDDPGLAELEIEKLLDQYPKSEYRPQAQYDLGVKYYDLGNLERAREVLTAVRDNYPKFKEKKEVLTYLAHIEYDVGDFEKALGAYETVYKERGNKNQHREGLLGMARCESKLGKHQEALDRYQDALKLAEFEDERAESRLGFYEECTYLGRSAEALKGFEKIIIDVPRSEYSAAAWYELGLIYRDYILQESLDSIQVDSVSLKVFKFTVKQLEPYQGLSQRLISYKLAERAMRNLHSDDPYSTLSEQADKEIAGVLDLYAIYEQMEASDSTSSRDALARLQFLLAEHQESTGEIELARAGYERLIFEFPNTIWVPKAVLNIARTSLQLGDSLRHKQALQLIIDNYPETRYADRARTRLGEQVPDRPAGFYLDELAAYTPPKIVREVKGAPGAPGVKPAPGQESWLQMRRRLWRATLGGGGGA